MITLKRLQWSNCFSYGPNNELDLDDSTVTQIIGTNGMGKSSIPLIIEEALYNKNSKGIKKADIPNRYIKDGYSIRLSFEKDGDNYEINIARKTGIKVSLVKNGEDVSSHTATNTYKSIQEIIGVDFKTFSQLVYQNTNASLQFLTATDTNRKKFLIELLHLDNYVNLFEVFKEASKESTSKVSHLTGEVSMIEKWLSSNKLSTTMLLPMLNLDISTEEEEKEAGSLSIELENISEKNKKISQNNTYKNMLSKINIEELHSLPSIEKQSYDEYQKELGQAEAAKRASEKMVSKLEGLEDICPTCEQEIDPVFMNDLEDEEKKLVENLSYKIEECKAFIQAIKEGNKEHNRRETLKKDWEDLFRSIDTSLPAQTLDKDELVTKLSKIRQELKAQKKKIQEIATENERRTRENTRIEVIKSQSGDMQDNLQVIQKDLGTQKDLNSNLEVLKKAFSTNGLLAYKIENLVKELEDLTNSYLAELSDGRFTLEFVVSNDKLNVQVTDNENIVDILALSSGELARVNTATLIAIRKLMSSISQSRINILFLDEVINVLDESGREKLVEVLLREELNTYVVSHGWTHPLLQKIEVIKDGNVSALEK